MRQFGLKLWSEDFSANPSFTTLSVDAVREGKFDYIELFALPDTYEENHQLIARLLKGIKVIIHAPHSRQGVDTGNRKLFEQNCKKIKDAQLFADLLSSDIIILHPGFYEEKEYIEESIRQFSQIKDSRLTVENLPLLCTSTGNFLHGTSPAQIKQFIEECGCRFCFDFSHAICAANSYKRDVWADLDAYQALYPVMYHMCDGIWANDKDEHLHYGMGNYPLKKLINSYTHQDAFITMETGKGLPTSLQPWLDDANYLRSLIIS